MFFWFQGPWVLSQVLDLGLGIQDVDFKVSFELQVFWRWKTI